MKKEISPEMYNYNKYPGPSFARVGDKVVSENIELDLLEDYKNAFDQTIFGQRFHNSCSSLIILWEIGAMSS